MEGTVYKDIELITKVDPENANEATDYTQPRSNCRTFITTLLKTLILIFATCSALAGLYVVLRFKRVHCLLGGILLM